MAKQRDITGQKFNRLTAIEFSHIKNKRYYYWLFKCDCGKTLLMQKAHVLSGNSKSCGCLNLELIAQRPITHGHTKNKKFSGSYRAWRAMKDRCARQKEYENIEICNEWLKFEVFFNDMGDRPKGKTLDRIDNSKGYEKDNCRWANRQEQIRNTGYRVRKTGIKFKGVTKTNCNRFRARIGIDYKRIELGCFETELEAAKAYNEAAKKYFGAFAQLNKLNP